MRINVSSSASRTTNQTSKQGKSAEHLVCIETRPLNAMLYLFWTTHAHATQEPKPGRGADFPASHSLQLASPLASV